MPEEIAISVKNVSKKYRLFKSHNERFKEMLHPFKKKYHKEFWALKDVSFDIKRGSTVGIIGRNGSGKSTLLQIICGVLKPTVGEITVNGRISALLELGAGFNPEMTGRQNVIMNGVVHGLSNKEINSKIPEIQEFADIGEFFDQPVKLYSSGMFVRLAFAASVNVDPDILIIDEALAVGDAKFQHKCYNKLMEFQDSGNTLLMVSHDMNTIVRQCDQAVLLEDSRMIEKGEPKIIVYYYLEQLFSGKIQGFTQRPVIVEEGYLGFNIVHYGKKYYALSQKADINDSIVNEIDENKCIVGASLEDIKLSVEKTLRSGTSCPDQIVNKAGDKTELGRFLEEIPGADNCINRRSYSKNEYRYGDKRAAIVDYLVVAGEVIDPSTICSGDMIDIYVKYIFYENLNFPIFGIAINTFDGQIIYGNNTRLSRLSIPSVDNNSCIIIKWTVNIISNTGDIYINLGIAELSGNDIQIDSRKNMISLNVQTTLDFTGMVNLSATYQEISRRTLGAPSS